MSVTDGMDRPPPFNDTAEQAVVGSIIIAPRALHRLSGRLSPSHFYDDRKAAIYRVLLDMDEQGKPIDLLTVIDVLRDKGLGHDVVAFAAALIDGVPDVANVEYYAGIVKRDADRRKAIAVCEKATHSFWTNQDVAGTAGALLEAATDLVDGSSAKNKTESASKLMQAALRDLEAKMAGDAVPMGIPTGIRGIDSRTHGFPRGAVTIVGAPPKVGKTIRSLPRHATGGHCATHS